MKYVTTILFAILFGNLNAQENKCLKEINDQVWVNFTKSFETFNHKLFESLHAENFVRASGNSKTLNEKKTYIKGYENRWKSPKNTQTISFRFLERFCDEKRASERGIYKFTTNPGKENEQSFYGKFHVVLVKKENNWNFLVDYDSDEGNTINKSSYEEAYGINDFSKY
jgi:hypothetical protein